MWLVRVVVEEVHILRCKIKQSLQLCSSLGYALTVPVRFEEMQKLREQYSESVLDIKQSEALLSCLGVLPKFGMLLVLFIALGKVKDIKSKYILSKKQRKVFLGDENIT